MGKLPNLIVNLNLSRKLSVQFVVMSVIVVERMDEEVAKAVEIDCKLQRWSIRLNKISYCLSFWF